MKVGAQVRGDALIQHRVVMASLLSTDCLLVQPRAEWDAGYLGIGALQIGSWNKREQENSAWPNRRNPGPAVCHAEGVQANTFVSEPLKLERILVPAAQSG